MGSHFGRGWLAITAALALHVTDEWATGFLPIYNRVVRTAVSRIGWWPMPTFSFTMWIAGLGAAIVILLALSPFAYKNARGLRPVAIVIAVIMLLNGLAHTTATIFGSVGFFEISRPAPGFYSSPLLIGAGLYLLYELRESRPALYRRATTTSGA